MFVFPPRGRHLAESAADTAAAAGGSFGLGGDESLSANEDREETCADVGVSGGAMNVRFKCHLIDWIDDGSRRKLCVPGGVNARCRGAQEGDG